MNTRSRVTVQDPERSAGWRLFTCELLIYLDPKTGEPLSTWTNPYTGNVNTAVQTASDPVNQPPSFPRRPDGSLVTWQGTTSRNMGWPTWIVPLLYDSPSQGDFWHYVGG